MNNHKRTVLTVITEASLESRLERDLKKLGASGYTITDARGSGGWGTREGDWDADSNIRVEVICSEALARSIAEYLEQRYYKNFAMVMYSHEVSVLRPDKF